MTEIGHNELAVPLAERAREETRAALEPFTARRDAITAAAANAFVTDEDSTGRAGDTLATIKALRTRVEASVLDIRTPIDQARGAVISAEDQWFEPLEQAADRLRGLIETHRTEERAKVAKQRAEQAETERQARAAAAARRASTQITPDSNVVSQSGPAMPDLEAPVVLAKVRGDYGSLTSDRQKAVFTIVDVRALPDEILLSGGVQKALQSAIRTYHRLKPEIPGVIVSGAVNSQTRS